MKNISLPSEVPIEVIFIPLTVLMSMKYNSILAFWGLKRDVSFATSLFWI